MTRAATRPQQKCLTTCSRMIISSCLALACPQMTFLTRLLPMSTILFPMLMLPMFVLSPGYRGISNLGTHYRFSASPIRTATVALRRFGLP